MPSLKVVSLLLLIVFFPVLLSAHEFNPAHLVVNEVAENEYQINWMYPIKNIGQRAEIIFPEACSSEAQSPYQQGKYLVEKIYLICSNSLKGQTIEVTNLSVLPDALVTITDRKNAVFEGLMNQDADGNLIPLTFDTLMEAKLYGWEFPDSVACVIRETNTKGKVKEHVYSRRKWANKKIKELLIKGHEFTIAADGVLEHVSSQFLE